MKKSPANIQEAKSCYGANILDFGLVPCFVYKCLALHIGPFVDVALRFHVSDGVINTELSGL